MGISVFSLSDFDLQTIEDAVNSSLDSALENEHLTDAFGCTWCDGSCEGECSGTCYYWCRDSI